MIAEDRRIHLERENLLPAEWEEGDRDLVREVLEADVERQS
jgi:hypothetical protein